MPFNELLGAGFEPASIGGPIITSSGVPASEDLIPGTTDNYDLNLLNFNRLVAVQVGITPHLSAGVPGNINCTATLTVDGDFIASWILPTTRDSWGGNMINELLPINKFGSAKVRLQFVTEAGGSGYNVYVQIKAISLPI